MSPRPYHLGQRQAAIDRTRAAILVAARELVGDGNGLLGFSMDAVARQAGVARMTVYYQFGSKAGLLEALFDSLAAHGGMEQLSTAFRQEDPLAALAALIATFCGFWASDRPVLRRLHGLAALDAELAQPVQARNERRRAGLGVLIGRLPAPPGGRDAAGEAEIVDILWALTSFETYDALAGSTRAHEEVVALLQRLAVAALGQRDR